MDRLEAMSLLLDTLDAGSFSAAARRRGIPVATVTRKIGQLEEQLGTVLLIRSTRRLALTDAGQRYVAGARQVLSQIDEIERDAAGEFVEPTGRLVVSAPRMFGRCHVLPLIGDFLRQHEGITVDLQLTDSNVDLAAGAADLALRIGVLPDSGLIATQLGTMRLLIVASPALLERYPEPTDPRGLAELPEVMVDILPPGVASRLHAATTDRSTRHVRLSVSGAEAAVDAAEAGIGFARLLHYQVVDSLRAGRLRVLLEAHEGEAFPVHFIHAPVAQLPLKTRRFLDHATDRLRASLRVIAATVS
ncbi:MAG: HTH-type transcriptional regulator DsdC [Luteibacter sp.]|uniref:LysR family transcriptional regulator n=1 Tax=Luteibacter sp. TaxID=1886636 RepID=UPI00137D0E09|nr:LysR substrate-binding domain-containing protein [Luteibacter sp.]KAF1004722.1 MAG: HTH-type transcriptional regulator DsdC [Luteibacter sp.]